MIQIHLYRATLYLISLTLCSYTLYYSLVQIGNIPYLRPSFVIQPSYPQTKKQEEKAIGILTFYDGMSMRAIRPLTEPNKKAYAHYHNYKYINGLEKSPFLMNEFYLPNGRVFGASPHFLKYIFLRHFLPLFDWILWSDADAIFLNFTRSLEEIIDTNYEVIATALPMESYYWPGLINSGHMLFHNSKWTIKLLDELIALGNIDCRNHRLLRMYRDTTGKWNMPLIDDRFQLCDNNGRLWQSDQGAIQIYVDYSDTQKERCHYKRVPFRLFNSQFPNYQDGDLVVHFPGRRSRERYNFIGLLLESTNFLTGVVDRTGKSDLETEYDRFKSQLDLEFPNVICVKNTTSY